MYQLSQKVTQRFLPQWEHPSQTMMMKLMKFTIIIIIAIVIVAVVKPAIVVS